MGMQDGESCLKAFGTQAAGASVKASAIGLIGAQDISATLQVLKVRASNPNAVYISSFSTPGATLYIEQIKRGYKADQAWLQGRNLPDPDPGPGQCRYLRIGGKDVEGVCLYGGGSSACSRALF